MKINDLYQSLFGDEEFLTKSQAIKFAREYYKAKNKSDIPGLDEVRSYSLEIGLDINKANEFFYFYSANGWMQNGNKPIKNWKAALHMWKSRQKQYSRHERF